MNLYIFPEAACKNNGYGIGVDFAYRKLQPKEEDLVVWYTEVENFPFKRNNDIIISRKISFLKRVMNILRCRPSTELSASDLSFLKGKKFDHIHCDEIIFFHALRHYYPTQHIDVRLHNVFARILERKRIMGLSLDPLFHLILFLCRKSEVEIFRDKNSKKIFISYEDMNYYTSMFGKTSDAEVWPYIPCISKEQKWKVSSKKLIWYGGLDAHKISSIQWFIKDVYMKLKSKHTDLEFYLYGRGTDKFDDRVNGIYGKGYYQGNGKWPLQDCLYINPDIIGGGIKLKIMSLFEDGIPFITTPFGFEGYSPNLIDGKICHVAECEKWNETIEGILYGDAEE